MSALFPEVDDLAEADDFPLPQPSWQPCSDRARTALGRLVALAELLPDGEIRRAEYSVRDAEVRLVFASPAMPAVTVMINPLGPRPSATRTRQLALSYAGAPFTPAVQGLLGRLRTRLMAAPFDLVMRAAVLLDPLPPEPPPEPPPRTEALRVLPRENVHSIAWSYLNPEGWHHFFEVAEMYRGIFHGLRGKVTLVQHADIECHASDAPRFDGSLTFFNFPRQEVWSTERGAVDSRARDGASFMLTDMDDRDVIKGSDARLERVLDAAPAGEDAVVFVMPTCISLVTGDDVDAAADRGGARRRVPVINLGDIDDPISAIFERLAAEPGFVDRPRVPGRVNLVGMPHFEGYGALLGLLREAGVEIGCEAFPTIDLETARGYMSAAAQVVYVTEQARASGDGILARLGLPTITPPAPFGVAGTREWVLAVAAAAGREEAAAAALARAWEPLAPRWNALRRKASGACLGFVVDAVTADSVRDPVRLLGVPILRVALEAGFVVRVLQHAPGPRDPTPAVPEAAATTFFRTPAELAQELRTSPADAFYSDVYADPRVTAAGKQVFSLRDVSMGLGGAVETARRLVDRCENPFLRRYGSYLGGEGA